MLFSLECTALMLKWSLFMAVPLINPKRVFCHKVKYTSSWAAWGMISFSTLLVITPKSQFIADLWQKLVGCQNLSILKWVGKEKRNGWE